jgi:DNA-binding MarR family transcriptional regulator
VAAFSFLTNHGLALLCIAHDPRARLRDIAASVGTTERTAQRIVGELIAAGYVERTREGRRNVYTVNRTLRLALPRQRDVDLNALLGVLVPSDTGSERRELIAETELAAEAAAR